MAEQLGTGTGCGRCVHDEQERGALLIVCLLLPLLLLHDRRCEGVAELEPCLACRGCAAEEEEQGRWPVLKVWRGRGVADQGYRDYREGWIEV